MIIYLKNLTDSNINLLEKTRVKYGKLEKNIQNSQISYILTNQKENTVEQNNPQEQETASKMKQNKMTK